jgi:hypothetical protein
MVNSPLPFREMRPGGTEITLGKDGNDNVVVLVEVPTILGDDECGPWCVRVVGLTGCLHPPNLSLPRPDVRHLGAAVLLSEPTFRRRSPYTTPGSILLRRRRVPFVSQILTFQRPVELPRLLVRVGLVSFS